MYSQPYSTTTGSAYGGTTRSGTSSRNGGLSVSTVGMSLKASGALGIDFDDLSIRSKDESTNASFTSYNN